MKHSLALKLTVLAYCLLISIIAALVTGFLVHKPRHARATLVAAGGAFGGSMGVCVTAAAFLFSGADP